MRLKIKLALTAECTLTFNYPVGLSAAIYETLRSAPVRGSHQYTATDLFKNFKQFVFSKIFDLDFTVEKGNSFMHLKPSEPYFYLSIHYSPIDDIDIINTFKNTTIYFDTLAMPVLSVDVLPELRVLPVMQLRTLSPIVLEDSRIIDGQPVREEPHPSDALYEVTLFNHLVQKYEARNGVLADVGSFGFQLLSKPKRRLIWIKQISHAAYEFDFEIKAKPELIKLGLECGFGSLTSLGCGYCEPINE